VDKLLYEKDLLNPNDYSAYLIVSSCYFAGLSILMITAYEIVDATVVIPDEWITNTELQCGSRSFEESFHHASFV